MAPPPTPKPDQPPDRDRIGNSHQSGRHHRIPPRRRDGKGFRRRIAEVNLECIRTGGTRRRFSGAARFFTCRKEDSPYTPPKYRVMGQRILKNKYTRRDDGTTVIHIVRRNGDRHRALIDTSDEHLARRYQWHVCIVNKYRTYARTTQYDLYGEPYYVYLHRLLTEDELTDGKEVHHISRDGMDCRRSNMVVLSHSEISEISPGGCDPESGHRNIWVCKDRDRKYVVRFQPEGRHDSKYFNDLGEAIRWRDEQLAARGYKAVGRRLVKL